ncbi:MAG: S9 family peptidase [Gammaproteobacteria bacterium]|nr:S9 family peptidase [Gammaproteobacteria bacterium]
MQQPNRGVGYWPSDISAEFLTAPNRQVGYPQSFKDALYWQEKSPSGTQIVKLSHLDGQPQKLLTAPYEVGTQANVYGGQAWCPTNDGVLFVNKADQSLYLQSRKTVSRIEHHPDWRFADFHYHSSKHLATCVVEIPSEEGHPLSGIAVIDLNHQSLSLVHSSAGFIAFPRWSEDGERLAFMRWGLDKMSWDDSQIVTARWTGSELITIQPVTTDQAQGVFQPYWHKNALWYVTDVDGLWEIYHDREKFLPLAGIAEFGRPLWLFGWSTFAVSDTTVFALGVIDAKWTLYVVDRHSGDVNPVALPFELIEDIVLHEDGVVFIGESADHPRSLCFWSQSQGLRRLRKDYRQFPTKEAISVPQQIKFPTANGHVSHGFFYAPKHPNIELMVKPPLMVLAHGGPTACNHGVFNAKIQYWTSRGFAVFDVNYRGSTGYGRGYRQALNQHWGVVDVEDVLCGVQFLIENEYVDPTRVIARGSSAGAFTLLNALRNNTSIKACACYYGVADLEALDEATHKFEACYNQSLVAPVAHTEIYRQRSPIRHIDQIDTPIIFFHGLKDPVVDSSQSYQMHEGLKRRGVVTELITYPDEGHGFRSTEVIRDSLEKELLFYRRVLDLKPGANV